MDVRELAEVLRAVPDARDVIVKGRKCTVISCSIKDLEPVPSGWRKASEFKMQAIPGYKRIVFDQGEGA